MNLKGLDDKSHFWDDSKIISKQKGAWGTQVSKFLLLQFQHNPKSRIRPICYNVVLARLSGSVHAGLFMSQLLYWWGRGKKMMMVYKTILDFELETGLTRAQQTKAIKIWEKMGILEVRVRGLPPVRHFTVWPEELIKAFCEYYECDYEEMSDYAYKFLQDNLLKRDEE